MENESCYVCNYAKHEINRGVKEVRCGLNNRFVAYPKLGCSNCKKTCTTNADHIRQMTDAELARFLRAMQIGALAAQFTGTGIDSEERLLLFLAAIYEEEQG